MSLDISYELPKLEFITLNFSVELATYYKDKVWNSNTLCRDLQKVIEEHAKQHEFITKNVRLNLKVED
jgi:hypothetical protein